MRLASATLTYVADFVVNSPSFRWVEHLCLGLLIKGSDTVRIHIIYKEKNQPAIIDTMTNRL